MATGKKSQRTHKGYQKVRSISGLIRAIEETHIEIMGQGFSNENYMNKKDDYNKIHFSFKLGFANILFSQ